MVERIHELQEIKRPYVFDFLARNGLDYVIDASFGFRFNGLVEGGVGTPEGYLHPEVAFVSDTRIPIHRDDSKNFQPKTPTLGAHIAILTLGLSIKQLVFIETPAHESVSLYKVHRSGLVAQVEVKATRPIAVRQVRNLDDVYTILERRLT